MFLTIAYITGGLSVLYALITYLFPSRKLSLFLKAGADALCVINLIFVYLATKNNLLFAGIATTTIGFFREIIFSYRGKWKTLDHIWWPIGFSSAFLLSLIFTYKSPLSLLPAVGSVISTLSFYTMNKRVFKAGGLVSSILYVTYYAILLPSSDVLTLFSMLCSSAGLLSSLIGLIVVLREEKKNKISQVS